MNKKLLASTIALALLFITAVPAFAAGPAFEPRIFADGIAYGTKGTTDLPAPTADNEQSFDGLFIFTNGVYGQLAVSEAGPENPDYNGGRWAAYDVTWNAGFTPELVTSYGQLQSLEDAGAVTVEAQHRYFQCPLLNLH